MKNKGKRKTAAILVAVMLGTLLVACNGNSTDPDDSSRYGNSDYVYIPAYFNLPEDLSDVSYLTVVGERLIFVSSSYDDERMEQTSKLYSMSFDGMEIAELENYTMNAKPDNLPDSAQGNVYINGIYSDLEGNIWVYERGNFFYYNTPDDYVQEKDDPWGMYSYYEPLGEATVLRKLDSSGTELLKIDLSTVGDGREYFWISSVNIDGDSNIYVAVEETIYVLDGDGTVAFKLEINSWIDQLFRTADGSVAFVGWSEEHEGRIIRKIDTATRGWGEAELLPINAYYLYPGVGKYNYFHSEGNNLIGVNSETDESEILINWINSGISSDSMHDMVMLPDEKIIFITSSWDYYETEWGVKHEVTMLSKVPADSVPQRTVLTLACYWLDWSLRSAIVNFNKTNLEYRIHVNEYQIYNTSDDYTAGLTKLNTEIISGNIPDMILTQNLPFSRYAARGLLEDLYPYIDADPEYNRANLVEGALRAAEMGGKLYQIFPSFTIDTLWGNPSVLGEGAGWSVDEFVSVLMENPQATYPMGYYLTKTSFLYRAVYLGMDRFIDWSAGTANFDSEEFIALLEFANSLPEEIIYQDDVWISEDELLKTGEQIMRMGTVYDFATPLMERYTFGGELVYKGFPTNSGTGHTMNISAGIAMTTTCKDKEAAWNFMRDVLEDMESSQRMYYWGFPVNRAAFDKRVEELLTQEYYTDADGNEVEIPKFGVYSDGVNSGWTSFYADSFPHIAEIVNQNGFEGYFGVESMEYIYAPDREELDIVFELIDSQSTIGGIYDESLMSIIQEDAESFFNGRSTAADAARVIQSRVSIYIAEQS